MLTNTHVSHRIANVKKSNFFFSTAFFTGWGQLDLRLSLGETFSSFWRKPSSLSRIAFFEIVLPVLLKFYRKNAFTICSLRSLNWGYSPENSFVFYFKFDINHKIYELNFLSDFSTVFTEKEIEAKVNCEHFNIELVVFQTVGCTCELSNTAIFLCSTRVT